MNGKEIEELRLSDAEETVSAETPRTGARATKLFFGMLYAAWGFVLGRTILPFGAMPFGIGLLAASDVRAFYVLGGLLLGAWGSPNGLLTAAVYVGLLLLRLVSGLLLDRGGERRGRLFGEHLSLRMASAAVAAFGLGVWRLYEGGYLYYDLYGTILSTLAAPAAVLLLFGFIEKSEEHWQYRLGFLTLGAMLCYGAKDLKLYGIGLGVFGAMLASLYVTRRLGLVPGMVCGTLFGFCLSPSLAPLFAFGALATGLVLPFTAVFGLTLGFGISMAWGYYVQGLGVLNGLFGGLLSAYVIFFVVDKLFLQVKKMPEAIREQPQETTAETTLGTLPYWTEDRNQRRLSDTNERIRGVCRGFAELSDVFEGLARRFQQPSVTDLRQICDRAFDATCTGCPSREGCWGEGYHETSAEVGQLCEVLHREGKLLRTDVPEELSGRCSRLPDLLEEINHNATRYTEELLLSDRTEIFALDYRIMSRLLASVMSEEEGDYDPDPVLAQRLAQTLETEGLPLLGVSVSGQRRKHISLWSTEADRLRREQHSLQKHVEELCGFPLEEGRLLREDCYTVLSLVQRQNISVRFAHRAVCADGESQYCGDTADAFFGEDGRFYGFISDGMGSGRDAALTSGIGGIFLRKLLRVGGGCEETLHLLNGFLRNRGSGSLHECSATVDLVALDLMEGSASFYKSGAAPTYVFRQGGLLKLRARTVPVGILQEPDIRKIDLHVGSGDLLVMVSDGVKRGKEECPWLFDLLRSHSETDPDRLADLIVKYAKEEGSVDDISTVVIRIEG